MCISSFFFCNMHEASSFYCYRIAHTYTKRVYVFLSPLFFLYFFDLRFLVITAAFIFHSDTLFFGTFFLFFFLKRNVFACELVNFSKVENKKKQGVKKNFVIYALQQEFYVISRVLYGTKDFVVSSDLMRYPCYLLFEVVLFAICIKKGCFEYIAVDIFFDQRISRIAKSQCIYLFVCRKFCILASILQNTYYNLP